jgi:nicotinamide phosphoribosyltransferase
MKMIEFYNPILDTDSYKFSHWLQYPPGTEYVYSYIESRGGAYDETLFFGLQYFIQRYLEEPLEAKHIYGAKEFCAAHGTPFNEQGWWNLYKKYEGKHWPILIRAVPEGSIVPTGNVLVDIINTDPEFPWLTSFFETKLLRAVWYPTTVASRDLKIYRTIHKYMEETADEEAMAGIGFKHNDFGARGASSAETSAIGGMAHLIMFRGTDNVLAVRAAKIYYNEDMAGFSIPAAEHSTMTSWGGREGEPKAMANMVSQFGKPGALIACVSDSYDIYNAVENLWGDQLLSQVKESGATVVIRPDSGDPVKVTYEVISGLMDRVGYTINSKGYKMLPSYYRIIQGDGVNENSIAAILENLKNHKISADNIAFGMGGAMLQQLDRDTLKFAMKCSAICVNGEWRDVFKDPITDHGKISKKGRLNLYRDENGYRTIRQDELVPWSDKGLSVLNPVYKDGKQFPDTFANIRDRAVKELFQK